MGRAGRVCSHRARLAERPWTSLFVSVTASAIQNRLGRTGCQAESGAGRAFRLLDAVRAEQRLSAWSRTSSPSAAAADFGGNAPICAILRHALSERCPHRGTKCHTGVSRHSVDSGGIGPATRFDARGLDLSAGECLSRGQSSTDVLPGSMTSTNNRKALEDCVQSRRGAEVRAYVAGTGLLRVWAASSYPSVRRRLPAT